METSSQDALLFLLLLTALAALVALAPTLKIPYPILLVMGGLAVGFVPGLPSIELSPELVLVVFLPPLLYYAAFRTSLRDFRRNARAITLLSVGLVLATVCAVAAIAHFAIDLPWAPAFVLGAILSPTDPIAATSIAARLGIPRRLVTVLEGESLVNDSTALIAYRAAVVAVVSGTFTFWEVGLRFVLNAVAGIAIGLAVGWIVRQIRRRLNNPPAEITISILTAYVAYLPAEALGVSAVLAAVTVGIYLGWHAPELTTPETRLQSTAVWDTLVFLLNAILFALIGLQLPSILDALGGSLDVTLLWQAALVSGVVILVRIGWVFPSTYLPRLLFRRIRERDPYPPWQYPALVAWAGMRGAVSLAAALALPLATDAGGPFPGRDVIIYLTFAVILVTLVLQGLSLPLLIRGLGLQDDGKTEKEETKARIKAAEAAIERLDELIAEDWVREDSAQRLRGLYTFRINRFAERFDSEADGTIEEQSLAYQRLRRELLEAERGAIVDLRRDGHIGDEAMRRIERDLDLEDTRLDA